MIYTTQCVQDDWEMGLVDDRLMFAFYALDSYMGGIRITSLVDRGNVPGRVKNTKHKINPRTGKCEAGDTNPPRNEKNPRAWRFKAKTFIDNHTEGIDAVIHGIGSNEHLHVEIDPRPPRVGVELI